jgi:flagellar motility protein MotE (MotC chaperone)
VEKENQEHTPNAEERLQRIVGELRTLLAVVKAQNKQWEEENGQCGIRRVLPRKTA